MWPVPLAVFRLVPPLYIFWKDRHLACPGEAGRVTGGCLPLKAGQEMEALRVCGVLD